MASTNASNSSWVFSLLKLTRNVQSMMSGLTFMAVSTWLRCPLAQALPAETQMPRSCNMLMEFWVGTPGTETDRMCGASCAPVSTTPGSAERRSESAVSSAASRA